MESIPGKRLLDKQTRMPKVTTGTKIKTALRRYGVLIATILVYIVFALIEPEFNTAQNFFNIVRMASIIGILSLGLTLVVCVGEFDMSFAAAATICGVLSIFMLIHQVNLYLTWMACIGLGIGISAVNAFNVIKVGIPSFIATLGMMGICTGTSRYITGGSVLYAASYPPGFQAIGREFVLKIIPTPVLSFAIIAVILVIFLEFARQGRYTYAVGGNPEAATHVGINIDRVKLNAFLIIGVFTGVAGIVMASMFGAGNPTMGEGFLMPAIIGCFLGAVFLKDGLPNSGGTLVSCFLLAILENGFVMTNVPLFMKETTQGAVLIIALIGIGLLRAKK